MIKQKTDLSSRLAPGPRGWWLAPEGAAVCQAERVAVVADVHLGYEFARAARGDMVPEHSLAETLAKLGRLFERVRIDRLIVAGDLVESPGPCVQTRRAVDRLVSWLVEREIELIRLAGNHDPHQRPALARTLELEGWTIGHGDRPLPGARWVFGHHHPVLRAEGLTAPCFLVDDLRIALPAFSPNAAGLDVTSSALPNALRGDDLRCVAGVGGELLDFGPLTALRALRRNRSF